MKKQPYTYLFSMFLFFFIFLLPLSSFAQESALQPEGTALRKLERGFANLGLGWIELVRHIDQPERNQFVPPWLKGLAIGTVRTVAREVTGVLEILTFPLPIPNGYDEIMQPEFVWEYPREKNGGDTQGEAAA